MGAATCTLAEPRHASWLPESDAMGGWSLTCTEGSFESCSWRHCGLEAGEAGRQQMEGRVGD